jgi:hypothetical protein
VSLSKVSVVVEHGIQMLVYFAGNLVIE